MFENLNLSLPSLFSRKNPTPVLDGTDCGNETGDHDDTDKRHRQHDNIDDDVEPEPYYCIANSMTIVLLYTKLIVVCV